MKNDSFLPVVGLFLCSLASATAQFPLVLPAASGRSLDMIGNNTQSAGGVAGYIQAPGFVGHPIISLNGNLSDHAYYFLMGAEATGVGNYTDTSKINTSAPSGGFSNMAATQGYISLNALDATKLTLRFGATGAATTGWSLGGDVNGTNYSASGNSTMEYRIYTAPPANVGSGLYYNNTKLLSFGYTPLYMIIDYATANMNDDIIQAYSAPVGYTQADGLSGSNLGLAQSLISDFNAGGGLAQLRFDSIQTASRTDYSNNPNFFGIFSFSGSVQVVPEPGSLALFGITAAGFGLAILRKRRVR